MTDHTTADNTEDEAHVQPLKPATEPIEPVSPNEFDELETQGYNEVDFMSDEDADADDTVDNHEQLDSDEDEAA